VQEQHDKSFSALPRFQLMLSEMDTPQPGSIPDTLEAKEPIARDTRLEDDLATFTARVRPKIDIQNYFVSVQVHQKDRS
jgi:hypothetical protein